MIPFSFGGGGAMVSNVKIGFIQVSRIFFHRSSIPNIGFPYGWNAPLLSMPSPNIENALGGNINPCGVQHLRGINDHWGVQFLVHRNAP